MIREVFYRSARLPPQPVSPSHRHQRPQTPDGIRTAPKPKPGIALGMPGSAAADEQDPNRDLTRGPNREQTRDLIRVTPRGLYCAAGDFYIDPWKPVERAVVTHAHADHCRPGHGAYLVSEEGLAVTRRRVHADASIQTAAWGEAIDFGDVRVSLHPAGHLLGSAQVRVERRAEGPGGDRQNGAKRGEVWVVSGDYKTEADASCTPLEIVPCNTFISESTFGLPIYRWAPQAEIAAQINAWWSANRAEGVASVLFSYALGKSQRLLNMVDRSIGPIFVHGSVQPFVEAYRAAGIDMPETRTTKGATKELLRDAPLVVGPMSTLGSPWLKRFGRTVATASASGWMTVRAARRQRSVETGFVLSDHADWDGLHATIRATGCERVGVTHGSVEPMVRYLRETGLDAFPVATRFEGSEDGESSTIEAGNGDTGGSAAVES